MAWKIELLRDANFVAEMTDKFGEKVISEKIIRALGSAGVELSGEAAENLTGKAKAPTGRLARSLTHQVKVLNGHPQLKVGSLAVPGKTPLPYARVRDLGGKISAKPGKFLAIPIKETLARHGSNVVTSAGIVGIGPRELSDSPNQYGFKNTFLVRGRKSPWVVMGESHDGETVPIFAYRRSVKQKGYKYLTNAMNDSTEVVLELLRMEFEKDA